MEGGILEVLVVGAEGIRHTTILGTPAYFIIGQCGTQVHRGKLCAGKSDKVCWNEKFSFEFSLPEWQKSKHLKLKIMGKELFSSLGFAGETIVHLGGIITEGMDRGSIELPPTFHNVVLEDDTYKGQIKIGFKFTAKEVHKETRLCTTEEKEVHKETRLSTTEEKEVHKETELSTTEEKDVPKETSLSTTEETKEPEKSICKTLKSIWKISLCKLLFYYTKRGSKSKEKHI